MTRIPQLAFPFSIVDGQVAVVEQDSIRDVEQCVLACLSTPLGSRLDDPEYGVRSALFEKTPVNLAPILNAVEEAEPRASLLAESEFEDLVERVRVEVEAAQS